MLKFVFLKKIIYLCNIILYIMDKITQTTAYAELSASVNTTDIREEKLTSDEINNLKHFLKYFFNEISYNNTRLFDLEEENRKLREEIEELKTRNYNLQLDINDIKNSMLFDVHKVISEMSENYVRDYCTRTINA